MRLVLMRHADAAVMPGTPDHDRPLTPRGERDATAMGRWLREHVPGIAVVQCSSAVRARRTCELVVAELTVGDPTTTERVRPPVVRYFGDLYRADADALFDLVREHNDGTLLVIGHNPAIAEAAGALAEDPLPGFPAGAVAVLESDAATTRVVAFSAPDAPLAALPRWPHLP
jgi:phosphohistidine phosphatase